MKISQVYFRNIIVYQFFIMKSSLKILVFQFYLIQIMQSFVIHKSCDETNKLESWISLKRKYYFLNDKISNNEVLIESYGLLKKHLILKNNDKNYSLELLEPDLTSSKWKNDNTNDMINSKCKYHAIKQERDDRFPHKIVHLVCNEDLNDKESEYKCTQMKQYTLILKQDIDKNGNEFWREAIQEVNSGCLSMQQQSIIIGWTN
jgi:hypothetical protein